MSNNQPNEKAPQLDSPRGSSAPVAVAPLGASPSFIDTLADGNCGQIISSFAIADIRYCDESLVATLLSGQEVALYDPCVSALPIDLDSEGGLLVMQVREELLAALARGGRVIEMKTLEEIAYESLKIQTLTDQLHRLNQQAEQTEEEAEDLGLKCPKDRNSINELYAKAALLRTESEDVENEIHALQSKNEVTRSILVGRDKRSRS
jgi:hypothetical protein